MVVRDRSRRPLLEKSAVSIDATGTENDASGRNGRLLRYDDLPAWYREESNASVLTSYRPVSGSWRTSVLSWSYIHNETANIYTHLVPALAALVVLFAADPLFTSIYPHARPLDRVLLLLYILAAITCFGLSVAYHTLINHSAPTATRLLRLDLAGILLLITTSFLSGEHVAFYCNPDLRDRYWALIFTSTALSSLFLLSPRFTSTTYRLLRLSAFVALGLSAFVPIAHGLALYGTTDFPRRSGLYYYLSEGAVVAAAATIYGARWPERTAPGKFDVWGSSHQIFHVLTVVTALLHVSGLWSAYDLQYHDPRC